MEDARKSGWPPRAIASRGHSRWSWMTISGLCRGPHGCIPTSINRIIYIDNKSLKCEAG